METHVLQDDYRSAYESLLRGLSTIRKGLRDDPTLSNYPVLDALDAFVRCSIAAGAIHDGSIIAYVESNFWI